jgi:hypothetical protein
MYVFFSLRRQITWRTPSESVCYFRLLQAQHLFSWQGPRGCEPHKTNWHATEPRPISTLSCSDCVRTGGSRKYQIPSSVIWVTEQVGLPSEVTHLCRILRLLLLLLCVLCLSKFQNIAQNGTYSNTVTFASVISTPVSRLHDTPSQFHAVLAEYSSLILSVWSLQGIL